MPAKPKCKCGCGRPATIKIQMANYASFDCAYKRARLLQDKAKAEKERKAKQEHRQRKESLKTRSEWLKQAQAVFNQYIRLRDAKEPCISCGREEWEIVASTPIDRTGGIWDAGHYLTRGGFPELRFEEFNAHRQCKRCNAGAGRFSSNNRTVTQRYRERLIDKIGLDKVEWLEGPHEPLKLSIDEIKALIAEYKSKVKALLAKQKDIG